MIWTEESSGLYWETRENIRRMMIEAIEEWLKTI